MGSSVLVSVSVMSLPRHPSEGWDLVDLGRRVRSARGSAMGPEIPAFAGMTAVGDGASEIALLLLLLHPRAAGILVDGAALAFRRGGEQGFLDDLRQRLGRSEEHTSELQSRMRI